MSVAAVVAATALSCCPDTADAELLGVEPGFPILVYDSSGMTTYDPISDRFTITAIPLAVQFMPGMPPRFVTPTPEGDRLFFLDAMVDENGDFVGGVPGADFFITGQVDQDGDGTADFSQILLAGEITAFGFRDTPDFAPLTDKQSGFAQSLAQPNVQLQGGTTTDFYDFRVTPTGGSLLSEFGDGDIAIEVTSEASTFMGDFTIAFSGGAKGNVGPTDPILGACCLADGTCDLIREGECVAMGGQYQGDDTDCTPAALGDAGCYRLTNNVDALLNPPPYGLRIDELIDVTPGNDSFTFDFDAPGSAVFLCYDGGSTIRIFGTAFGGRDIGNGYDPAFTGFAEIDFTYTTVGNAAGDDDLEVRNPTGTNTGHIVWLNSGVKVNLVDQTNSTGFTFRFGDGDDEMGQGNQPGLSGLGWLRHGDLGPATRANDWIFGARPICVPFGACCFADGTCEIRTEDECDLEGGDYLGDATTCDDGCRGACCLPGGDCVDVTLQECEDQNGLFLGEQTDCDSTECPGACCFIDVTGTIACESVTATECAGLGGLFFGEGIDCSTVACGGACCLVDGSCVTTLNVDECIAQGGEFQGNGSDCSTAGCREPGACCLPDTMTCTIVSEAECDMAGGDYFGDGSECLDNDMDGVPDCFDICPDGDDNLDCDMDGIPDACETDCNSNGIPDDCENGPDCNNNGIPDECEPDCDSDGIPDDCEDDLDNNGTPDDCEQGACCIGDTCQILTLGDCVDQGGDFLGSGSECEHTPGSRTRPGTYRLANGASYPQGGLVLYNFRGCGTAWFDFDDPRSSMYLHYDNAGVQSGNVTVFGMAWTDACGGGTAVISMTYTGVIETNGELRFIGNAGSNTGTLTWLPTGEVIDLIDKPNGSGFTFRLFDNSGDDKGTGWFMGDNGQYTTGDFHFEALPDDFCPIDFGACCTGHRCQLLTEDKCTQVGGTYQGDGSDCTAMPCGVPDDCEDLLEDFEDGENGWDCNDGVYNCGIEHNARDGGDVFGGCEGSGISGITAGPMFSGDLSAYNGGTIGFLFMAFNDRLFEDQFGRITLVTPNGNITTDIVPTMNPNPYEWMAFSGAFNAAAFGVSEAQFAAAIANVTRVEINLEIDNLGTCWCLDNFFLSCGDGSTPPPPPSDDNDDCVDAQTAGMGANPFSTIGATTDGPAHDECDQFDSDEVYNDVWFTFTAPHDGDFTFSTCNDADFDTRIVIYDNCHCDLGDDDVIDCNDDYDHCSGYTSRASAWLHAGECVTIRIGSYDDDDTGTGVLTIDD